MPRRRGFTLIELLVVIAIIAILAAILFPVFLTAKRSAQKAACQSNVREILQAAQMYEDDNGGGILPGCVDANGNGSSWGTTEMNEFWCSMIDKYVRQLHNNSSSGGLHADMRGVYVCPAAPRIPSAGVDQAFLTRTYGYNYYYLGGDPNNSKNAKFHKTSEVVKATKTIRILENWNFRDKDGAMLCYPPSVANVCKPNYVWPPGWHAGSSSVGWMDGHVSVAKFVAPRPNGPDAQASDFTGVLTSTLNGGIDPYFRLDNPKP